MAEPMSSSPMTGPENAPEITLGSLRANWFDLMYATLFYPVRTFRVIAAEEQPGNRLLFFALITVVLISSLAPIVQLANLGGRASSLAMTMPFSAVLGTLIWIFMALVISGMAMAFSGQSRIRTFLILSGLATLPWLLMGPVSLLKIGLGTVGLLLYWFLSIAVWLWSILLFIVALMNTYHMTAERVAIVMVMPFVMLLVLMGWLASLVNNLRQLLPP